MKSLDYVGQRSTDLLFHHSSFSDLMIFVHWDLLCNDQFVHFTSILSQQRGVPIGGSASAQYACLVMLFLETNIDRSLLPPILRHCDNLLVFLSESKWTGNFPGYQQALDSVHEKLQLALQMPLQFKQRAETLHFLEVRLFIHDQRPSIGCKPPCFDTEVGTSHPPSDWCMLDAQSPNARRMMLSLVPNVFKKCQWYQFSPLQFVCNIVHALVLFEHKGFPSSWWYPALKARADRVGASHVVQCAMRIAKECGTALFKTVRVDHHDDACCFSGDQKRLMGGR